MLDEEQRQHITELLRKTERRLQILEQQKASFGLSTEPHIIMEIEELERDVSKYRRQLQNSSEPAKPLALPTSSMSQEAQSVLKAAKTWGTTLKGWLSKLSLLDTQERLSVLRAIINSPQEEQATAYMFAALSSELPPEEITTIVNEMVRRVTLSEGFGYKANFMSAIPVEVLRLASASFLVSFFGDIIDIMNGDQFSAVNLITPAVIKVQDAVPETLEEEYIKALMEQANSSAFTGGPAARSAALALPDKWAMLGLQTIGERELIWRATSPTQDKFYKSFLQRYTTLWPDEKRELYQDYLTLSPQEIIRKYGHIEDDD